MPLNLFPGDPGSIRPGPEPGRQAGRVIEGGPGPFIDAELGPAQRPASAASRATPGGSRGPSPAGTGAPQSPREGRPRAPERRASLSRD